MKLRVLTINKTFCIQILQTHYFFFYSQLKFVVQHICTFLIKSPPLFQFSSSANLFPSFLSSFAQVGSCWRAPQTDHIAHIQVWYTFHCLCSRAPLDRQRKTTQPTSNSLPCYFNPFIWLSSRTTLPEPEEDEAQQQIHPCQGRFNQQMEKYIQ